MRENERKAKDNSAKWARGEEHKNENKEMITTDGRGMKYYSYNAQPGPVCNEQKEE